MHSVRKPWWQQATALVTVSTGGVITGFTFVPGAAAAMTSPSSVPLHLLALEKAAKPAGAGDDKLRSAIVNVAGYYLRLAQTRTPAQMEALIWDKDSLDGADHGPSCAAFASLTLELAAQAVGEQSWVTGGSSYPWPLREWADVRVDPNPSSLAITSIVQDAQAHQRWHPLGDGYRPEPGDWVLFSGHVEVVTSYANGVLDTIGADSLPNLTVNAHSFDDPLAQQGVEGFVDNGHRDASQDAPTGGAASRPAPSPPRQAGTTATGTRPAGQRDQPVIPGSVAPAHATADIPGDSVAAGPAAGAPHGSGAGSASAAVSGRSAAPYRKTAALASAATPGTKTQQAFISQIAPGAIAAQQRFGVPASVTIAQAIDESAWGTSQLAANDYNLFGIKGTGPAGSVSLPTQELENGEWVTVIAQFRVYHNVSESVSDHAELLATSGYYTRAMADRALPDAFANDLTGVYATDPEYGANLIALMKLYNLYRFDTSSATAQPPAAHPSPAHQPPASLPSIPGMVSAVGPALASTPAPTSETAPTASGPAPSGAGSAAVPGMVTVPGGAGVAGIGAALSGSGAAVRDAVRSGSGAAVGTAPAQRRTGSSPRGGAARVPGVVSPAAIRYAQPLPAAVATAFFARAKAPLARAEQLHRDVAANAGIRWQLLAACDWMQCHADHTRSPVQGERLGTRNADGTVYATKSEALAQCASDLVELARAVYGLDLTAARALPVRALADVFAAFRWGGLLKRHGVSAMEFPYSVAGLTAQHLKMHWPVIDEPAAPDKPGSKFRAPFGAVPVLLSLNYPAVV